MRIIFSCLLAALALFGAFSCSTDVDLTAEPKDIWVVYGVLNPNDSVQYIRVAKAFLVDGNALQVAKDSDLSAKNIKVELWNVANNRVITRTATAVVIQKDSGTFYRGETVYRFATPYSSRLFAETTYNLRITRPDQPSFKIEARTTIPTTPDFNSPGTNVCGSPSANPPQRFWEQVPIESKVNVVFKKKIGYGYELRAGLNYRSDGVAKTATWYSGKVSINQNCQGSSTTACYEIGGNFILASFLAQMQASGGNTWTYNDSTACAAEPTLSRAFWFESTAVDTFFSKYLVANAPQFTDLNDIRPEYTNLNISAEKSSVYGIFGAINTARRYCALTPCGKYLLRLNNAPKPEGSCSL